MCAPPRKANVHTNTSGALMIALALLATLFVTVTRAGPGCAPHVRRLLARAGGAEGHAPRGVLEGTRVPPKGILPHRSWSRGDTGGIC